MFYHYNEPIFNNYVESEGIDIVYDDECIVRCPKCGSIIRFRDVIDPITIRILNNNRKKMNPDFLLCSGTLEDLLFSERVKEAYEQNGLSGVEEFVEISNVFLQRSDETAQKNLPKYYRVKLKTSCMTVDHEKTDILFHDEDEVGTSCEICNPEGREITFFRHMVLNENNNEGYDVFHTYDQGWLMFFSEKFVSMCKNNGFKAAYFEELEKWDNISFLL